MGEARGSYRSRGRAWKVEWEMGHETLQLLVCCSAAPGVGQASRAVDRLSSLQATMRLALWAR